ncbi:MULTISPECIES: glutamyl-tRNA reductase [unclassified Nitratiruptor]|uniref:glutamyl-tRNA reductase n=1 Tax=unclassified Nitratiruptor TaxID=2624044 RepID=UPI00191625A2|nr:MULTISPECIES: glutamyl-tRNA reductase [unclassified Nitratiruptor]BCD60260.1 glutamyl-tRNA reductase [Nitratiruptor sp. YY08-10]BCD64251.1 glutamyl-tRNA reductase [Nitratiruptor sp. YY08-14]
MQYLVISFSHKNTDIVTREKLALSDEGRREEVATPLLQNSSINEVIILSTCNRIEIILSVKDPFSATEAVLKKLSEVSGIHYEELEGRADIYEDNGAIHHVFSVASGLDSLVVGETQITGQIKDAYKEAYEKGWCGQKLGRVMHYAFKCSKEVRSSTDITRSPVSVASAAVNMAKEKLGNLGGMSALVVGAGEMGRLAAKHLISHGCNVILVGRDLEKTKTVAQEIDPDIRVEHVSNLQKLINSYRLLFSATSSKNPVITKDMVKEQSFDRYWFDMAVPRDIEEIYVARVHYFAVDDLKEIVNKNMAFREEQARNAYKIVGHFVNEFFRWLQTLEIDPIIKEIRKRAKESAISELQKAIKKGYIPKEYEKSIEKLLHNAFNRFLHDPTKQLKAIADEPRADTIVEAIKFFFEIEEEVGLNRYKCEYYMNLRS